MNDPMEKPDQDLQERIIDLIKGKNFKEVVSMVKSDALAFYIALRYLQQNLRQVDEWLPFLKEFIKIQQGMPKWVVCMAFEKGFITLEEFKKMKLIEYDIQLNAAEIYGEEKYVGMGERYFKWTKAAQYLPDFDFRNLKRDRTLPGLGHPIVVAIFNDDVKELSRTLAMHPELSLEGKWTTVMGKILVEWAIEFGSMACFRWLRLNNASKEGAMTAAIRYNRTEMIELLLEEGQTIDEFDLSSAVWGCNFDLVHWLLTVKSVGATSDALKVALTIRSNELTDLLIKCGAEPDKSCLNASFGFREDLSRKWMGQQDIDVSTPNIFEKATPEFAKSIEIIKERERCVQGYLRRDPFDADLAEWALTKYGTSRVCLRDIQLRPPTLFDNTPFNSICAIPRTVSRSFPFSLTKLFELDSWTLV